MIRGSMVAIALLTALLRPVVAGEQRTETLKSSAIGMEVHLNVILPDGYAERADSRYPVIYLLHGYGGDYNEWARVGVKEEAAGLQAILVLPEGDKSFYINHHDKPGARWEDYIIQEVVPFIDGKFRTQANRAGRAISGLSMGGYGAVMIGLRHPELFASVASHSGALGVPAPVPIDEVNKRLLEIFGPEGSKARKDYNLVSLLQGLPEDRRPDIYIDCGSQDFLLQANREFVAELARLKTHYEYREVPGAHDFAYWRRNVRYSMDHQLAALRGSVDLVAAKPAAAAAAASLTGVWKSVALLPGGEERRSTLHLVQEGEKITGRNESERGVRPIEKGKFAGGQLTLEFVIAQDGQKAIIRVEAKASAADKLAGQWKFLSEDGQELGSGDWSATAESLAAAKPAAETPKAGDADKKAAAAPASLAGVWDMTVTSDEGTREYVLTFKEQDKALQAVLTSPRSGDHSCKQVLFKDGTIRFEIEREFEQTKVTLLYEGVLKNGEIAGTIKAREFEEYNETWKARRAAEKKSSSQ